MKLFVKAILLVIGSFTLTACLAVNNEKQHVELSAQSIQQLLLGNSILIVNRYAPSLVQFRDNNELGVISHEGREAGSAIWRTVADKLCTTDTSLQAERVAEEHCMEMKMQDFGDTWTADDARNGRIKYTFLEGHPTIEEALDCKTLVLGYCLEEK